MDQIPSTWNPSGRGGSARPLEDDFSWDGRFSAQDWVDESCREQLRRVLPRLVEALSDYGVRLVFLSGSAGLGEAVGWEGDERFVLSDLDLGVVLRHAVPADVHTRLARELDALSDPVGAEVGFGLYPAEALPRQVPTPGAVDFLARRRLLWGDPKAFGTFPPFTPEDLPSWEGYRLVGNRCRELLFGGSAGPGGNRTAQDVTSLRPDRARIESLYLLGKWIDGIATASLVFQGRYLVGRSDRWQAFTNDRTLNVPVEILDAHAVWRTFLERPAPETAPSEALADSIRAGSRALQMVLEQANPETGGRGIEDAFLRDPRTLADRLRAWRAAVRDEPMTTWSWALRSRFVGSPEIRRLGAAVLYWLSLPEDPEPDWGRVDRTTELELWSRVERLLGDRIEPGAGAKNRLRSRLGWDGATFPES